MSTLRCARGRRVGTLGFFAACVLLVASNAHAQFGSAVAAGTAAGVAAGQASSQARIEVDPVLGDELEGWQDRELGLATRITTGCAGITSELIMSGTALYNYLNIAIANQTGGGVGLVTDAARVRFADGRVRRLESTTPGDLSVDHDWWVQLAMRFPDKVDFRCSRTGMPAPTSRSVFRSRTSMRSRGAWALRRHKAIRWA